MKLEDFNKLEGTLKLLASALVSWGAFVLTPEQLPELQQYIVHLFGGGSAVYLAITGIIKIMKSRATANKLDKNDTISGRYK